MPQVEREIGQSEKSRPARSTYTDLNQTGKLLTGISVKNIIAH